MDYRELLKKYIRHVGEMEGIDFLGERWRPSDHITDEEWKTLNELSEETWNAN